MSRMNRFGPQGTEIKPNINISMAIVDNYADSRNDTTQAEGRYKSSPPTETLLRSCFSALSLLLGRKRG